VLEATEAQEQQHCAQEQRLPEQEQQIGGSKEDEQQHGEQQQEGAEAQEEQEGVEGLLLVTARTALWGRFPLNGTYFQASIAQPCAWFTARNAARSLRMPQALWRSEIERHALHASHALLRVPASSVPPAAGERGVC
jgi:hypothetical protein